MTTAGGSAPRSSGSSTCVEARLSGDLVLVRNSNDPTGPTLSVTATDWLAFLDDVAAGLVDYSVLATPPAVDAFVVTRTADGLVELADPTNAGRYVVRYTKLEWDIFVAGVTMDGEFSVNWLRLTPSPS